MKQRFFYNPHYYRLANFFGSLGYIACAIQWLWVAMIYMETIAGMSIWNAQLFESESKTQLPTITMHISPEMSMLFVTVTIVLVIAIMLYVVYVLPRSIARTGRAMTHTAAIKAVPLVASHKKLTKKETKRLTITMTWWIKYVLIIIPLVATFGAYAVRLPIPTEVVIMTAAILAAMSMVWFGCQYLLGRVKKLDQAALW